MFQTKIEIPTSELKISYENHILTLGSCFAQNIGNKMQEVYFETEVNPFGVLYNPVSISKSINLLLDKEIFTENDIFQYNGLWLSFSHSSLFSDTAPEKCIEKINFRFVKAAQFLQITNFLLITFGTAWVYEDQKSGSVISNCHKLPARNFSRRRLSQQEIVDDYSKLITRLNEQNPELQLIFSVSPIRHWKDGAHENNLSKSTLMLAIDELQHRFNQVHYFPAYEIQMDELRDYRFYASDMLHPSEVAVDYIWQRFSDTYFDEATTRMKKEFEQLLSDLNHKPLFPDSTEFQQFQENVLIKKKKLNEKYIFLNNRLK